MKDISLGSQSLKKLKATTKLKATIRHQEEQYMALIGQTPGVVKLWRFSF